MSLSKDEKDTILRFVTVNDVYELDDLPRLATALREAREQAGPNVTVLAVLAGDFLAPSILSSLDKGRGGPQHPRTHPHSIIICLTFVVQVGDDFAIFTRCIVANAEHLISVVFPRCCCACAGMVDVLNHVGLDYVCFGNHETDVPHNALLERIRESNFGRFYSRYIHTFSLFI